ncbi:hypothetical protein M427DRAFT_31735 [Gonapodya prolifera JEL478]|uniref:Uncharacterized protein n=1 Tax=Gonapodya prolifera (strain JEL478) TaxID=1344416 RepID=A0A139AI17_GONPJ|nr:hypothetical protein M427DRAFT_31735 [Gonapodya prolifera JEL478]|eukprot:KXS16194.1 hypothetical protein M427DRAFT_31735 [Gonapodya prolifera JEL478]
MPNTKKANAEEEQSGSFHDGTGASQSSPAFSPDQNASTPTSDGAEHDQNSVNLSEAGKETPDSKPGDGDLSETASRAASPTPTAGGDQDEQKAPRKCSYCGATTTPMRTGPPPRSASGAPEQEKVKSEIDGKEDPSSWVISTETISAQVERAMQGVADIINSEGDPGLSNELLGESVTDEHTNGAHSDEKVSKSRRDTGRSSTSLAEKLKSAVRSTDASVSSRRSLRSSDASGKYEDHMDDVEMSSNGAASAPNGGTISPPSVTPTSTVSDATPAPPPTSLRVRITRPSVPTIETPPPPPVGHHKRRALAADGEDKVDEKVVQKPAAPTKAAAKSPEEAKGIKKAKDAVKEVDAEKLSGKRKGLPGDSEVDEERPAKKTSKQDLTRPRASRSSAKPTAPETTPPPNVTIGPGLTLEEIFEHLFRMGILQYVGPSPPSAVPENVKREIEEKSTIPANPHREEERKGLDRVIKIEERIRRVEEIVAEVARRSPLHDTTGAETGPAGQGLAGALSEIRAAAKGIKTGIDAMQTENM